MTEMFAQYLHHATIRRKMIVDGDNFFYPGAILYIEKIPKTIRIGLVWTEETEIPLLGVSRKHISHHLAELTSRLMALCRRFGDFNRIVCKWRNIQINQQLSAISVRIGTHTTVTFGCKRCEFWYQATIFVEHFFWSITAHPFFQYFQVLLVHLHFCDRDLMCPKCA